MTNHLSEPLKKGLIRSAKTLWLLTKIIIPISCLIVIMDFFKLIDAIAYFFAPLMYLVGLPGEAAIALALGFLVNFYAAIGAITVMQLGTAEITVLAVMLGISHDLPVETAVCRHTGLKVHVSVALRITAAMLAGVMLNLIFHNFPGV